MPKHVQDNNFFQGYDEHRYDLEQKEKKETRKKIFLKLLFWIISVPIAICLGIFLCKIMIAKTKVANDSMEPTLSKNDSVIINTLTYRLKDPKRFEVIVFRKGDDEHSLYDIKRIYGMPGETIQIKEGVIFINGKELEDEMKLEEPLLSGVAAEPYKLGDNEYFVLADDRNNAEDSRYSSYGMVKRSSIIGKAWIRTNEFNFINMLGKKK
jgi:signal peptidase I